MKLEIIGRDPKLTMQITKMIGERTAKEKKRKAIMDVVMNPFGALAKWIGGKL